MITQFTVGVSKTVNVGNFNSIKIESSLVIVVSEEDDFTELKRQAQEDLKILLEETWRAQRKGDE